MRRFVSICWLLTLLVALVSCGGNAMPHSGADTPNEGTVSSSSAADPTTSMSASAAGASAAAGASSPTTNSGDSAGSTTADGVSEIVGSLTRSGGIQGKTETLVINADGTLQLLNGDVTGEVFKTAQGPRAQVESLQATFASTDWQGLAPKYGKQVPDGFEYTVRGGNKEVVTYDGASNPPVLETVLSQMNALWQIAQASE